MPLGDLLLSALGVAGVAAVAVGVVTGLPLPRERKGLWLTLAMLLPALLVSARTTAVAGGASPWLVLPVLVAAGVALGTSHRGAALTGVLVFAVGTVAAMAFLAGTPAQTVVDGVTTVGVRGEWPEGEVCLALLVGFAILALVAGAPPGGARRAALVTIAVVTATFAIPSRPPSPPWTTAPPPADGPPDILLVTVDTLRYDTAREMAAYRALAARGTEYTQAWSAAPWTLPSMASLMTGLSVAEHGAAKVDGGFASMRDDVATLAEGLRERGYDTVAVVAPNVFVGRSFGFDRGFDWFFHEMDRAAHGLPLCTNDTAARLTVPDLASALGAWDRLPLGVAEVITARAARVLAERRERPLFLWVHYLDTHEPYRHASRSSLPGWLARQASAGAIHDEIASGAMTKAHVEALYAHEAAIVDRALLELIAAFDASREGGVVVLTSDHGEELLERTHTFGHGHTLYEELLHVPLVTVGLDDGGNGAVIDAPTANHHLAARLRAVAEGREDARALPTRLLARNLLYGSAGAWAVREGDDKLVMDGSGPLLFDLGRDPEERHDRAAVERDRVDGLRAHAPPPVASGDVPAMNDAENRMLEALGYLE